MPQPAAAPSLALNRDAIFILGNGPSLAGVDLKLLSRYSPTLGMNAAYRYWNDIGWRPQYYACLDLVVGLSHRVAIGELLAETDSAIEAFLLRANLIEALGDLAIDSRIVNFDALRLDEPLLIDDPVTTGSHATLWAASLGYQTIILAGIDGRYMERVGGARSAGGIELEIAESGNNPNYFFDAYQQPGDRYCVPNPRPGLHAGAWRQTANKLAARGVLVANVNRNSEVREFPYVDLSELVEKRSAALSTEKDNSPANLGPRTAPASHRPSVQKRFTDFAQRSWKLAFAGVAVTVLVSLAATLTLGASSGVFSVLIASGVMVNLVFIALLYVRIQIIDALARLNQEIQNGKIAAFEAGRQAVISNNGAKHSPKQK